MSMIRPWKAKIGLLGCRNMNEHGVIRRRHKGYWVGIAAGLLR